MIPTKLYDSYNIALMENDRQARLALKAVVSGIGNPTADAVRDVLLEAYPELVKLYGTRSAQVALEFYEGVRREQQIQSAYRGQLQVDVIDNRLECVSDVRREVGGLYSKKNSLGTFTSKMQQLASKRTLQMADSTLYALANADPAKPKVALVPHAGACAWCVLIGSRGFTNTEKAMDNMRHDGCKCVTVVDFDKKNPALDGYNPKEHYRFFEQVNTDENKKRWREEWNAMSDEERSKYIRRSRQNKAGELREYPGDWSTYVRNRTVQEMNVLLGNTKGTRIG